MRKSGFLAEMTHISPEQNPSRSNNSHTQIQNAVITRNFTCIYGSGSVHPILPVRVVVLHPTRHLREERVEDSQSDLPGLSTADVSGLHEGQLVPRETELPPRGSQTDPRQRSWGGGGRGFWSWLDQTEALRGLKQVELISFWMSRSRQQHGVTSGRTDTVLNHTFKSTSKEQILS